MLPVEIFAEVTSFFTLYDLTALEITSKLCRGVAQRAAGNIRAWEYPGLILDIRNDNICIIRGSPFSRKYSYDFVYFADGGDLARFILSALPNCVVGGIVARGDHLKEIRAVANAVVVMGPLTIYADDFESNEQIIDFVESFRFVKELSVWPWENYKFTAKMLKHFEGVCRRKRIREFRSDSYRKVTFLENL
ncbi:hypothetical protein AAVH_21572 [Aphelenchoides avenae]|nr:hypothetical protein AAVH_21572 [Aphelenchus avenae]